MTAADQPDSVERYLNARSQLDAGPLLDAVLKEHVWPVVSEVVRREIGSAAFVAQTGGKKRLDDDIEDAILVTVAKVANRLKEARGGGRPVDNVRGYAAVAAKHVSDEFYRKLFNIRYNVKVRVASTLKRLAAFYEWKSQKGERHGALSEWQAPPPSAKKDRVEAVHLDPKAACAAMLKEWTITDGDRDRSGVPTTAAAMWVGLKWCSGALVLDSLTDLVQAARNEYDELPGELHDAMPFTGTGAEEIQEIDAVLLAFWTEIAKLSVTQARAILLDLDLGNGVGIEAFLACGAASLEQMATLLGFGVSEFRDNVLPSLPFPTDRIAELLKMPKDRLYVLRSRTMLAVRKGMEDGK